MVSVPHLPEFNSPDAEYYILYCALTIGNEDPFLRGQGVRGCGVRGALVRLSGLLFAHPTDRLLKAQHNQNIGQGQKEFRPPVQQICVR